MHGAENWFVLETIFGEDFGFQGAELDNMIVYPLGGSVFLEWIVSRPAVHPPEKWTAYEKIYVKTDFYGVSDIDIHTVSANQTVYIPFIIRSVRTEITGHKSFTLIMESENGDTFRFVYQTARIQNVKPMMRNPNTNEYEVTKL